MAFSFQEQQPNFLLGSAFLPKTPAETLLIQQAAASCFTCPYSSERNDLFGAGRDATQMVCASMAPKSSVQNKRKSVAIEGSLNTGESKDIQESKKRARNGAKQTKKPKINQVKQGSEACNFDPTAGYIHVRARRGQATDSHSLAERVRREKISERMKMLQGLVPGCEKVTGKALMLDEIINYVQSLQNQVEFLSMKIASLSPILYDFSLDFGDCIINPPQWLNFQKVRRPLPCLEQTKTFGTGTITNYQLMDEASAVLASFSQDGGSALQMDAQSQEFLDPLGLSNMCSFQ